MIPDINLLPKVEKRASKNSTWLLAIIIVVLFSIIFGIYYASLRSDVKALDAQQQALSNEINAYQKQIDRFQKESQGSFDQSVKYVESVSYPVTPIIDSIESHLQSYEKLTDLTYGEAGVTITADFETLHGVSTYVQNLLTDPLYTDVQVTSITSFEPDKKEYQEATPNDRLVPRYTATIQLTVNQVKLLAEGERP